MPSLSEPFFNTCTILLLSLTLMYLLQSFAFHFTSNLRSEWVFVRLPTCSDGAAATMRTGPGSPDNVWPLYLPATTAPPLSASARTPEHLISATEHPYPWKTERKEEVRNKDSESLCFSFVSWVLNVLKHLSCLISISCQG